ncbi:hypothetical protein IFO70_14790 [Phormidium tenue FACHB-886]|nr:hypothetical protein [Phormidium tenue FACHB-886]
MPKLQAVQIDEETIIYIEAEDEVEVPEVVEEAEEKTRGGGKGWGDSASVQIARNFEQIQSTIRTYTKYTLNAFRDAALADVQKVTLEFGVNTSGEGGLPYVAKGTIGCNVKVVVECAFQSRQTAAQRPAAQPANGSRPLPQQAQQSQAQLPPRPPAGLPPAPAANL